MIFQTINATIYGIGIAHIKQTKEDAANLAEIFKTIHATALDSNQLDKYKQLSNAFNILSTSPIAMTAMMATALIAFTLDFLMVLGVVKRKHTLMAPFVYMHLIAWISQLLCCIFITGYLFYTMPPIVGAVFLPLWILTLAVSLYFWFCVYSHYRQLRCKRKGEETEKPPEEGNSHQDQKD